MCDPISATAATVAASSIPSWVVPAAAAAVSAAAGLGGAVMSSQAQASAANAIRSQNLATQQAQQDAFIQRMGASNRQTDAQSAVMQQTMADRAAATNIMRQGQQSALQRQQDILDAENKQAEALRGQGDTQAQQLLAQTNQTQLAASQTGAQNQAAMLLGQVAPQGPQPTDPRGTEGDTATQGAVSRRLAEAATNIRTYGSKVAAVNAYSQPTQDVNLAITGNQTGIMPAIAAEKLLAAGSGTRLLPSQVAYRNAGDLGAAMDTLISSRGQSGLDTAALSYGNQTGLANLTQSDATTLAANTANQAKADAAAREATGGIISGLGNLGLYGTGYYFGGPSFLKPQTAPA